MPNIQNAEELIININNAEGEDIARIDGYYEDMTVGNAEQLVSSVFVKDEEPYSFRTSGGSADIGNRLTEKIIGGTIAWNQIQASAVSRTYNGITYTFDNGKLTVSGTATAVSWWVGAQQATPWKWHTNHVYLVDVGNAAYSHGSKYWAIISNGALTSSIEITSPMQLVKMNVDVETYLSMRVSNGETIDPAEEYYPQVFDLTQMFGAEIANYIYTLEQSTAGAGVAWFKNLFPKPYYQYNAAELMSVKAASHDTLGFNAFDIDTNKAKLISGNQYQITGTYTSLSFEGETIMPQSGGYFTPSKNGELTVIGSGADTCVHLVWSGYRDGEYEDYKKRSYPLDTTLELHGIPRLDSANKLYYDGDTYESDGTVTRRFREIVLDGITTGRKITNVATSGATGNLYAMLTLDTAGIPTNNGIYHIISDKFISSSNQIAEIGALYIANTSTLLVLVHPDQTLDTAEKWNTWLQSQNITIVYEVAEPTTEQAEPFQSPQIVDDFGTEEYIDYGVQQNERDVSVPVGHETQYMSNLRDKLQRMPDMPNADGDYLVRCVNGELAYVISKIPSAPTTDGDYNLRCTVLNGEATYSWESVS